jgi:hypothetical protein
MGKPSGLSFPDELHPRSLKRQGYGQTQRCVVPMLDVFRSQTNVGPQMGWDVYWLAWTIEPSIDGGAQDGEETALMHSIGDRKFET